MVISVVVMVGAAAALAGCTADSHAPLLPKMMLAKEAAPRQLDPEPDVKLLLRDKRNSLFTAASHPRRVRVAPPRREPNGSGWTVCVKAEVTSVIGKPLGTQTYLVTIGDGLILGRRRVEADDNCASESYEPI